MVSDKQILANRVNARKSTGPRTAAGRFRSRRNALRHGLTARTVVHGLEDDDEFRHFAKTIANQYRPSTFIETELVNRLISILWRLRRAHSIETGLLSIQSNLQRKICVPASQIDMLRLFGLDTHTSEGDPKLDAKRQCIEAKARAFLRLVNFNGAALDQLNRYEVALWRQAAQLILMLDGMLTRTLHRPI